MYRPHVDVFRIKMRMEGAEFARPAYERLQRRRSEMQKLVNRIYKMKE